jgi:hypothetical protein
LLATPVAYSLFDDASRGLRRLFGFGGERTPREGSEPADSPSEHAVQPAAGE